MAAPIIKHNPFASEKASLNLVDQKERKKQQKELLKLAAVLKKLESGLTTSQPETSEDVKSESSKSSSKGKKNEFEQILAEMTFALEMLQVKIGKARNNKAKMDESNSQALIDNLKKALQTFKQKMAQEKNLSFWMEALKIAGYVLGAIITAVSLAFGQVQVAALTMATLVITSTPLLKDVIQGVCNLIESADPKMSKKAKDTLNLIVTIAFIVAIVALSLAAGDPEGAPEEIAEETGEELGQISDDVESGVEESSDESETDETTNQTQKQESKITRFRKKISFKKFSHNLAFMNAMGSLAGTDFVSDLMNVFADFIPMSKQEKEDIEIGLSILVAVLTLVATLGAGATAFTQAAAGATANVAEETEEEVSKLTQLFNKLKRLGSQSISPENYDRLIKAMITLQATMNVGEGGIGVYNGITQMALEKAKLTEAILQVALNMNNETTSLEAEKTKGVEKAQKLDNKSIKNIMKGEAAVASVLTNYSPV